MSLELESEQSCEFLAVASRSLERSRICRSLGGSTGVASYPLPPGKLFGFQKDVLGRSTRLPLPASLSLPGVFVRCVGRSGVGDRPPGRPSWPSRHRCHRPPRGQGPPRTAPDFPRNIGPADLGPPSLAPATGAGATRARPRSSHLVVASCIEVILRYNSQFLSCHLVYRRDWREARATGTGTGRKTPLAAGRWPLSQPAAGMPPLRRPGRNRGTAGSSRGHVMRGPPAVCLPLVGLPFISVPVERQEDQA